MSEADCVLIDEIDRSRVRARLAIRAGEAAVKESLEIGAQVEKERITSLHELEEALSILRISGLLRD